VTTETVLITGASSGIGREFAERFAADKANLVLVARSEDKLDQLAAKLRQQAGVDVRVIAKDLTDPAAPQAISDQLDADGVSVDVLVNNAGFGAAGTVAGLPLERQINMIELNVTVLTHLTRLFLPGMLRRRRGGVLNVASTAAFQPGPHMAVYFATKAYVLSFTEALAVELSGTPVRATCLAPGPTHTGFGAEAGMENSRLFKLGAMDPRTVAAAGHRAFRRGKVIVVPGLRNKLGTLSARFVPRAVVRRFVKWLTTPA